MLTAAVISPDLTFRRSVKAVLASVDIYTRDHPNEKGFDDWFVKGFESVYREGAHSPRRPDVLIVDVAADPALVEFAVKLLTCDVGAEVIAVIEAHDVTRDSHLLSNGVATLLLKSSWNATDSRLIHAALKLAGVANDRTTFRLRKALGLGLRDGAPPLRPVFLCHASGADDADSTHKGAIRRTPEIRQSFGIRRFLEEQGIYAWHSESDVPADDAWRSMVYTALERTRILVPVINKHWLKNDNCRSELEFFLSPRVMNSPPKKTVIPVIVDPSLTSDARVESLLSRWSGPDSSYPLWTQVTMLVEQVKRLTTA